MLAMRFVPGPNDPMAGMVWLVPSEPIGGSGWTNRRASLPNEKWWRALPLFLSAGELR